MALEQVGVAVHGELHYVDGSIQTVVLTHQSMRLAVIQVLPRDEGVERLDGLQDDRALHEGRVPDAVH